MTIRALFLSFSLFLCITSAFAVDFNVKMSQYCRLPNGNFQAYSDNLVLDLIPENAASATKLNKLASIAKQTGNDVSFTVSGSVISEHTYPGPHGGPEDKVLGVMTYEVK